MIHLNCKCSWWLNLQGPMKNENRVLICLNVLRISRQWQSSIGVSMGPFRVQGPTWHTGHPPRKPALVTSYYKKSFTAFSPFITVHIHIHSDSLSDVWSCSCQLLAAQKAWYRYQQGVKGTFISGLCPFLSDVPFLMFPYRQWSNPSSSRLLNNILTYGGYYFKNIWLVYGL